MYKITSLVFGQMTVEGKPLGYNETIIVDKVSDKTIGLQENRLIKVTMIPSKTTVKEEKSKKKNNVGNKNV